MYLNSKHRIIFEYRRLHTFASSSSNITTTAGKRVQLDTVHDAFGGLDDMSYCIFVFHVRVSTRLVALLRTTAHYCALLRTTPIDNILTQVITSFRMHAGNVL